MKCLKPRYIIRPDVEHPDGLKCNLVSAKAHPEWFMLVPCGHCRPCRKAKAREWSIKLLYESEKWSKSSFISLDYAPEHLPMLGDPPDGCSYEEWYGTLYQAPYNFGSTLDKFAVSDFMKRVRSDWKRQHGTNLDCKYFYCGEYGDKFGRPHYHIIMFGLDSSDRELLEKNWSFGQVDIGRVDIESIQYVTGYVRKKLNGKLGFEVYGGRQAPFQNQSKGFGLDYFNQHRKKFEQDLTAHFNGHKVSIPRYYLKKDEDLSAKVKLKSLESSPPLLSYLDDPEDFCRDLKQRTADSVRSVQIHTKRSVF